MQNKEEQLEIDDPADMDELSKELLELMEKDNLTALEVVRLAGSQSSAEAIRTMRSLQKAQCYFLQKFSQQLGKASRRLDGVGCWQLFEQNRTVGERAGVLEDMEHATFQAAADFADKRMAKLSRRYSKD